MTIFAKLISEKGTLSDLYEECDFSFVVMFCLLYYEVMCYRQRTCNEVMRCYALNAVSLPNSYVEALTPSGGYIWRWSF